MLGKVEGPPPTAGNPSSGLCWDRPVPWGGLGLRLQDREVMGVLRFYF